MTRTAASAVPYSQTVVVVKGTPEMRELLDAVLESNDCIVLLAESTGEAYTLIRRVQPQLVLVGLGLDDPDGYELLSMLKLDPTTRRTRVLTCTSAEAVAGPSRAADATADILHARLIGSMN